MSRYWIMTPIEGALWGRYDEIWDFNLANGYISIGWSELDDASEMSREELAAACAKAYPDKTPLSQVFLVNAFWNFYHVVKPGDWIIARKDRHILKAVGRVAEPARYAPNLNPAIDHKGFLKVEWQATPRDIVFQKKVFASHSIYEIPGERFAEFCDDQSESYDGSGYSYDASIEGTGFAMEEHLESFIVKDFKDIFKDQLEIFIDKDGKTGKQYNIGTGRIDILAVDRRDNSFLVIELKKGHTSDEAVGQILRYMGWVKENLCSPDQHVKGLVICKEDDLNMRYALQMVENVDIRYYKVSFDLSENP